MKHNHESAQFEELQKILMRNPFAVGIGMELLEAAQGYARARLRLQPQLLNIYGGMHGGCAFSLADTLAGMAAATYGNHVTTLDASFNYMRPVIETQYLYCEARVLKKGAAISVVRTELTDDNGKLLIDGSFTYYHLQIKK
ncbi:hypothetical protein C823_003233 [Eubacterium plexicaudatum ASF492]|uniref:Thioesterase domain-containing protein n=1 Tax=Eubacterium plexicaudatum ASF492 TaxID=1235802 RepID=N2AIJ3_9FIRM|nr:hypothetical protein C823_003233 [Eubacterium plexicaudatum ASF492]